MRKIKNAYCISNKKHKASKKLKDFLNSYGFNSIKLLKTMMTLIHFDALQLERALKENNEEHNNEWGRRGKRILSQNKKILPPIGKEKRELEAFMNNLPIYLGFRIEEKR